MAYQSYFDIKQPTYDPAPSPEQKKKAAPKPKPKEKPKKGLVGQIYHNLTHNLVTDATGGLAKGAINTVKAPVNLTRTAVAEATNNEKAADSAARQTKDAYDNSIAAGIVNSTAKPIIEKSKKQFKYLSGRSSTQAERSKIIKNQEAAKDNEYKTATRGLKGDPGVAATIEAENMATKGRKAPEIRAYLDKAVRKMDENERRAAGTAASTASLAVGAGSLNTLSRAEIAKRVVPTATAGFVGSEGAVLAENPNATQEELGQAGITGLIAGAVLPVGAYGVNKVNPLVKPRNVAPEVTSTFNEASRRADTASNAGKTAVSKPIFEQPSKTTKIPVQDAVDAPKASTAVEPVYYHTTEADVAKQIQLNGFKSGVGERSKASHGDMQKGVFLYPDDKPAATEFGKNLKKPAIVEANVKGKVYDANEESKYGWEDDLQTQEVASNPEILAQLKKDGYVGVTSTEQGIPTSFVFDQTALKAKTPPKGYTPFAEAQKQQNKKAPTKAPEAKTAPTETKTTDKQTFYHGTSKDNNFTSFDLSKAGTSNRGKGVYLTDNPEAAKYYSYLADHNKQSKDLLNNPDLSVQPKPQLGEIHEVNVKGAKIAELDHAPTLDEIAALKNQGYDGVRFKEDLLAKAEDIPSDLIDRTKLGNANTTVLFDASKAEIKALETKPVKTSETPKPEGKAVSRVYQRLKAEHPELQDDVSYEAIQLKKDAEKAIDLIAKDKQEAFDIAMGARTSPDVTSTSTNIALAQKALQEGDDALYNRLVVNRSLAQTRRGQELVAEKGSITDNSTDRYVKELIASRLDHVGKKYLAGIEIGKKKSSAARATKVIDDEVVKLEKKVKARKLDTKTALALLDQMECL